MHYTEPQPDRTRANGPGLAHVRTPRWVEAYLAGLWAQADSTEKEELAARLGVIQGTVSRCLNREDTYRVPADDVPTWDEYLGADRDLGRHRLISELARRCGGEFVPHIRIGEEAETSSLERMGLTMAALNGEYLGALEEATSPDSAGGCQILPSEAAALLQLVERDLALRRDVAARLRRLAHVDVPAVRRAVARVVGEG